MPKEITKAYAISDAKITFVSLVDKAANKKQFLITKAENGTASFQTFGRILKADAGAHYVTGIVYEPMVEDTQGNYMTEEEITKAAHWFAKNGSGADLQHNFELLEGAAVVESSVTKCDMELEGEPIKKGTWLMTMEITNPDIFEAIEKREITGFSMGGSGIYSEADVDITDPDNPVEKSRNGKGILKQLAGLFGLDVVEKSKTAETVAKGKVKENYQRNSVRDNFWTAYYALSDYLLDTYNPETQRLEFQHDENIIREALEDFNEIVTGLLTSEESITKSLSIEKAGKKMSCKNKETLKGIHDSLGAFLESVKDDKEEEDVTKNEVESIVNAAIQKAMNPNPVNAANSGANATGEGNVADGITKDASGCNEPTEPITAEAIEKMVTAAIEKAMHPQEESLTLDQVQGMITDAVAKAMEPVMRSTGLPSNMNDTIQKNGEEEHYMHGLL